MNWVFVRLNKKSSVTRSSVAANSCLKVILQRARSGIIFYQLPKIKLDAIKNNGMLTDR